MSTLSVCLSVCRTRDLCWLNLSLRLQLSMPEILYTWGYKQGLNLGTKAPVGSCYETSVGACGVKFPGSWNNWLQCMFTNLDFGNVQNLKMPAFASFDGLAYSWYRKRHIWCVYFQPYRLTVTRDVYVHLGTERRCSPKWCCPSNDAVHQMMLGLSLFEEIAMFTFCGFWRQLFVGYIVKKTENMKSRSDYNAQFSLWQALVS